MHVSALSVYPVKSCRGVARESAAVRPAGLADDREWMVLDDAGEVLTARTHRVLLGVGATPTAGGGLVLSAAGRAPLTVEPLDGAAQVTVAGMSGMDRALGAGAPADEWLSDVLGQPVRLVRLDDAAPRTLGAEHGGYESDTFNLSDAGPVLLATTASLRRLDECWPSGRPRLARSRSRWRWPASGPTLSSTAPTSSRSPRTAGPRSRSELSPSASASSATAA